MAIRVAVIGAGASGLAALHRLTAETDNVHVTAFERSAASLGHVNHSLRIGQLGEVFRMTGVDDDGLPVNACMFQNLRTNLPKDSMKYFDFPHKSPVPTFTGHEEMREYLQSYADHFQLLKFIKFKTLVTRVTPVTPENPNTKWEVTFCMTTDQGNKTTEVFDYIVICNGHNYKALVPNIPGLDKFRGEVVNSHEYRVPDRFAGKRVVVVGGGPFALDISKDLRKVADKVFLSMDKDRTIFKFNFPDDYPLKPDTDHVTENSVVFVDGSEEDVDVIITCAGYCYNFPFLTDNCKVTLVDGDKRVTPLYKHMVNIEYPSMFFIGIQEYTNNISVADLQASVIASVLSGTVTLPTKEAMEEDFRKDFDDFLKTGLASRHYHKILSRQFELIDSLLDMMGKPGLPKGYELLFDEVMRLYVEETLTYRQKNFEVVGETYRTLPNN